MKVPFKQTVCPAVLCEVIVVIGFTVIVAQELFADAHAPLVTTVRYWVVTVKLVAV